MTITQVKPKRILDLLTDMEPVTVGSDRGMLQGRFDSVADKNYTNIRHSKVQVWRGQVGYKDGFVVFSDPEYSVRAFYRILKSYSKRGITTVKNIADEYAPKGDGANQPSKYVKEFLRLLKEQFRNSPITSETSLASKYYPYLAKTFVFLETSQNLPIEYFINIYRKYEHN